MARGEASAVLIVPKGFSDAVPRNQRCQLKVVTNPSQRILPRIVEEIASVLADGAFYLNAIAGDQLRVFAELPPGGARDFVACGHDRVALTEGDENGRRYN